MVLNPLGLKLLRCISLMTVLHLFPASGVFHAQMLMHDPKSGKLGPVINFGEPVLLAYVDYREALASEQLCPDKIIWKGKTIRLGQSETGIVRRLGEKYEVADGPVYLRSDEIGSFCLSVLREQPNTMHFYNLLDFQEKFASGWLKTYAWHIDGVGKIIVTFSAPDRESPYTAQFIRLRLIPLTGKADEVKWFSGNTLRRRGNLSATWNIDKNFMTIGD